MLYFYCYVTIIYLSAVDSSDICLADFLSDSKEESFSLIFATRTDSLPCDFPVFILKLSECKQVEFSAAFLDDIVNYLVSIKDTVKLYLQLNLFLPLLHHKRYPPLLLTFITHHLFCLKRFNKLNGLYGFSSNVWYTTEWLFGFLDGLDLRTNEDAELGFPDGK